uniref:DDE Tnp4 domain-containing protein n=1 Tax=Cajanus cajan TaxID=3821 RepID=A0A151RIV5_CAJCA|nr:hypothetical protein KK1_036148 [Cajanus cajan]
MYVLSEWEGLAYDSKLLSDVLTRRNGLKESQGKYFLADCGFSNIRQILAPFQGVQYHLQDVAGHGNDHQNKNEVFNLCYASLKNLIRRIFGIFKSCFIIFKSVSLFLVKTQAKFVLICVLLHNFFHKECRSDEFLIESMDESSSSVLPVMKTIILNILFRLKNMKENMSIYGRLV